VNSTGKTFINDRNDLLGDPFQDDFAQKGTDIVAAG